MLSRPPSSPAMAILKPKPSSPMRLSTGTRQSSKLTCAVGWECQPSFFSWAPKLRPGVPFSTTMQEMPAGPSSPVRTMHTSTSDPCSAAPEMNALEPLST